MSKATIVFTMHEDGQDFVVRRSVEIKFLGDSVLRDRRFRCSSDCANGDGYGYSPVDAALVWLRQHLQVTQ